jgi:hypothetical protein
MTPTLAFVGLFATGGAVTLYQREGFTSGDMTGMYRLVKPTSGFTRPSPGVDWNALICLLCR